MKKTYIQPDSNEIILNAIPLLNPASVSSTEAEGGTDGFAPTLNDDELFQLFLIK